MYPAVQAWDLQGCVCLHTFEGHISPVRTLDIVGNLLLSTGSRRLRVWDLETFQCVNVLKISEDCGALCSLACSSAGKLYVGGQVGSLLYPVFWPGRAW